MTEPASPKPEGAEYVYKTVAGRNLHLYVMTPEGWCPGDKRAALVWFHGGGWTKGSPNQFAFQSRYLASRGMVTIKVEYRLIGGDSESPAVCIQDAKSAMRWVRSHASSLGVDPVRIVAGGGSAGAHLAASCALLTGFDDPGEDVAVSPRPDALVLLNPVFDNGPDSGFAFDRVGDRYREFSPAHNIGPAAPPALIMVGSDDHLVPLAVVDRFRTNMASHDVRCEVIVYEGEGHALFNPGKSGGKYACETLREIDKFLASLGCVDGPPTVSISDLDLAAD